MSTLILVFHPHLKDGSRVNARLLAELTAQGEDDIIVRDEYAEYPNFSLYIRYICVAAYGVSRGCGCGGCGNDTLLQGDGDAIPRAYLRSIV